MRGWSATGQNLINNAPDYLRLALPEDFITFVRGLAGLAGIVATGFGLVDLTLRPSRSGRGTLEETTAALICDPWPSRGR